MEGGVLDEKPFKKLPFIFILYKFLSWVRSTTIFVI